MAAISCSVCGFRARWYAGGKWWCSRHDPLFPRCVNYDVHPATSEELLALGVERLGGGRYPSPTTPHAIGTFVHRGSRLKLCEACAIGLPESVDFALPTQIGKIVCSLCRGTTILRDEDEKPFACVCTPAGRFRANGITDDEVRRKLEFDEE